VTRQVDGQKTTRRKKETYKTSHLKVAKGVVAKRSADGPLLLEVNVLFRGT